MGIGIGNFRWMTALDAEHGGISMAAHNAYLLALAEGGIVLLACYLFLFWITARDLSRTLQEAARRPEVGLELADPGHADEPRSSCWCSRSSPRRGRRSSSS